MKLFCFTNGDVVNLEGGVYWSLGNGAGTCNVITFRNYEVVLIAHACWNPNAVLVELQNFSKSSASVYTSVDPGVGYVITSVSPSVLIPAHTGSSIVVQGSGFVAASLGTIWVVDFAGGMDSNGVSFTPTFVSSTQLSAVWASNGDGGTPTGTPLTGVPVMLYYMDNGNVQSNFITVTLTT